MSGLTFTPAVQTQGKARIALIGPSGSGKTYSALAIGQELGARVAVIDTERGSASKYASLFAFDVLPLSDFSPLVYVAAIKAASDAGYDVLIIDSLSHAWMGTGGALAMVDAAAKRDPRGNSYTAWRDVTPLQNQMVDAILAAPLHVIATMRVKTEYVMEKDERTGKMAPRKVGLAPIQRDGMEYEFDLVGDLDANNTLIVSKSRCPALNGAVVPKPGQDVGQTIKAWLSEGAPEPQVAPTQSSAVTPVGASPSVSETSSAGMGVATVNESDGPAGGDHSQTPNLGPAVAAADDPKPTPADLDSFKRGLAVAEGLKLDLAAYEFNAETISRRELLKLGAKLRKDVDDATKAKTAQQPALT